DGLVDPPEDLELLGLVLDDRLDHELAVGELGEVGRVAQAGEGAVPVGLGQLAGPDGPVERRLDPLAAGVEGALVDLPDDDVETGPGADLGDPGTHEAAAHDADSIDLAHADLLTARSTGWERTRRCPARILSPGRARNRTEGGTVGFRGWRERIRLRSWGPGRRAWRRRSSRPCRRRCRRAWPPRGGRRRTPAARPGACRRRRRRSRRSPTCGAAGRRRGAEGGRG